MLCGDAYCAGMTLILLFCIGMSVKCHVLLASSHFYSFLPHHLRINYCYETQFYPTRSIHTIMMYACRASSKLLLLSWTMKFNLILLFFFFLIIIRNGIVHCVCNKIKQENVPCELSTHAVVHVHATAVVSSSAVELQLK